MSLRLLCWSLGIALPQGMRLATKIGGLVLCLFRLQTFCIDKRGEDSRAIAAPLVADAMEVIDCAR
jgi:hypothetical protein